MRVLLVLSLLACACGDGRERTGGTDAGPTPDEDSGAAVDGGGGSGECAVVDERWAAELLPFEEPESKLAVTLDAEGSPVVAWVAAEVVHNLYVSERSGADWVHERVVGSTTAIEVPGLVIDGAGTAHVLYGQYVTSTPVAEIATRGEGGWDVRRLMGDRAPETSTLSLAPDGTVRGTYHDLWNLYLVSPDAADGWTEEVVDDGMTEGGRASAGLGNDLLIDADGVVHVSYQSAASMLVYARSSEAGWARFVVDEEAGTTTEPKDTAIARTSDGVLHIAYRDSAMDALVIASGGDGGWSFEVVDSTERTGFRPQLEVDDDGVRHLAYTRDDDSLWYANDASGAFEPAMVAAPVEPTLAMAVSGAGTVHLVWKTSDEYVLCLGRR